MSDIITARYAPPTDATALPLGALLSTTVLAALQCQYRRDLNRDRALCQRLDRAGAPADHVRRRIAVTRAALAEMEAR